ncbi:hypothetical protein GQ457_02G031460 [Hibiscus cannabinus]
MVSTPPRETRLGCVHSTPPRETGLGTQLSRCPLHSTEGDRTGLYINWGNMRAAAVFRVDAIVNVSTPLHRGRQDLGRRNCRGVHSTEGDRTGCTSTGVTCVPLLSSG